MDSTMTDQPHTSTESGAARIVSQGDNIRQLIHELTANTIRDRSLRLDDLQELVQEVFHGATEGLQSSMPADPDSALRQVFDGVSDAVAASVHAARTSLDFARQRSEKLTERDLKRTMRAVSDAEQRFLAAVSGFAGKVAGATRSTLNELVAHARKAGTSIRPAATAALKAAKQHPAELIEQTVTTGIDVARKAAGSLFMAAGGLLAGVGEGITAPSSMRTKSGKPGASRPSPASQRGGATRSARRSASSDARAGATRKKAASKPSAKKNAKKTTSRSASASKASSRAKPKTGSTKPKMRGR